MMFRKAITISVWQSRMDIIRPPLPIHPSRLLPGDQTTMNFGAQLSSLAKPAATGGGGRNPIIGIAGLFLLLGGAGMGIYLWRARRQ